MREDLAPVDPLPDERVLVRAVEAVPRELLRHEARPPGSAEQLRPTGTSWPLATLLRIRCQSSGFRSFTHAYCCACEHTKRYSGYSSMYVNAVENVRRIFRYVSASGHSHAVSMCACPTAAISC